MALYAFFEGRIVPMDEARIPVMTHALHYGTAVFEGIRGNFNEEESQVYLFQAREHFERLRQSAHIVKINIDKSAEEMAEIARELVRLDGLKQDMYVRPLAYKSEQIVANMKAQTIGDDFLMFAIPLGNYLDPHKGIHCGTSSWRRIDDLSIPARAKVTGLYVNSVMAKTEATENGFDEAIMLNADGHVAEGSGENIFLVSNGKLVTPAPSDNVLIGITMRTVTELAREELGIETVQRSVDRSELYIADECFMTGTAAHLTPVTKVDHRAVGNGTIGPVTRKLQDLYFDTVRGKEQEVHPVVHTGVRGRGRRVHRGGPGTQGSQGLGPGEHRATARAGIHSRACWLPLRLFSIRLHRGQDLPQSGHPAAWGRERGRGECL